MSNFWVGLLALTMLAGCSTPAPLQTSKAGFLSLLDEHKKDSPERNPASFSPDLSQFSRLFLRWPLSQVTLTSRFGKRDDGFHEGIDLKAKVGTPVYSAESGLVIYSGSKVRGYGRMVVLKHQGKIATIYAHHSKNLVHRGQRVKKGQLIAYSGESGQARGPHVHFEVRMGVMPVDPMAVIRSQN